MNVPVAALRSCDGELSLAARRPPVQLPRLCRPKKYGRRFGKGPFRQNGIHRRRHKRLSW
jgi:hypothetical protein